MTVLHSGRVIVGVVIVAGCPEPAMEFERGIARFEHAPIRGESSPDQVRPPHVVILNGRQRDRQ